MKKMFRAIASLFMLGMMLIPALAQAQMPAIGVDPEVKIGKLPNGLTYYIRHNDYPKGQADFYIAQKVGSINEEDNQRGLAHFLEHMCFNGTTHFPGNSVIKYLESVGVKFGQNLNAYTAVDQTVYNISNVPVAREGVQDSCLLVLHDWANDLLLLPEEIDAERKVIHEEWRSRMVGQSRIIENLLPVIYPGDRYGYRYPIGTMEVVDNFKPQALRDYYEKWYRPDLQGIIVVGDIDVERIENKIKEMFSDIEMPANPAERIYLPVSDTKGTIYAIGHDPEQTNTLAQLMFKTEAFPDSMKNSFPYFAQQYVVRMMCDMLNNRLNKISSKPDAPFGGAFVYYDNFFLAKTKDALTIGASSKDGDAVTPVVAAYRELLRAARFGFTKSEYNRVKDEYLSRMERVYNNRKQRESDSYVQEYVNHFLNNEPIPGIESEYEIAKMLTSVPQILDMINQTLPQLITTDNRVLLALMPDNAEGKYPTEDDYAKAFAAVDAENMEAYVENVKTDPFIANLRPAGKIVKEEKNNIFDATVWTLSNGATVIVKPTKFKDDEILFSATAINGTSKYGDDYASSIIFMPMAMRMATGFGTYNSTDVDEYLAGKQASVTASFRAYQRNVSGHSTPKDLNTLGELIYSMFTEFNLDADEFKAAQSTVAGQLANQEADPQYIFSSKVMETLFKSPRQRQLNTKIVNEASREQILEIVHSQLANAADYTFTFVGNVNIDSLRPMVEKYIASLPAQKPNRKFAGENPALDIIKGSGVSTYTTAMQTPQTWCYIAQFGTEKFTNTNRILASVTGQILSKRLNDIIREREGMVYSIHASGSMERIGADNTEISSGFPMKPELKDKALDLIEKEFERMGTDVQPEELNAVKEFMVKSYTQSLEQNGAWLSAIAGWSFDGVDTLTKSIDAVNAITVDDVKAFAKKLRGQGNYRVVVLDPAQ
ncbi:MAG: insulinase family protein [Paramuribaculum sp.]|nr:insulinase family protein [Paramuribaculum sp.]